MNLRPSTLNDLVYLYDLTRVLSRQTTRDAFLLTLQREVVKRFTPPPKKEYRVAFPYGANDLAFYGLAAAAQHEEDIPMRNIAQPNLNQRQGILGPGIIDKEGKQQRLFTMAAPLIAGDIQMGALVLQTWLPYSVYDEEDLKPLVLLAGSAAPILYAIENMDLLAQDNARLRALSGEGSRLVGGSRKMGEVRSVA